MAWALSPPTSCCPSGHHTRKPPRTASARLPLQTNPRLSCRLMPWRRWRPRRLEAPTPPWSWTHQACARRLGIAQRCGAFAASAVLQPSTCKRGRGGCLSAWLCHVPSKRAASHAGRLEPPPALDVLPRLLTAPRRNPGAARESGLVWPRLGLRSPGPTLGRPSRPSVWLELVPAHRAVRPPPSQNAPRALHVGPLEGRLARSARC